MDDNDFEVFFQTMTVKDLKDVISENKDVPGLSKYRKADLIEAFLNLFTEKEQEKVYKKWMPKKIKDNIDRSINILTKWRNVDIQLDNDLKEYSLEITWPGGEKDTCTVNIQEEELSHKCNCRIGEKGGVCSHLIGLTILLYLKEKISLDQFPFLVKESWLNEVLNVKNEILNNVADVNDADIDLNEYWIFIRGKTITTKWSGDYAGTKTVDLSDSKESVEDWIVKKVVDKQLEFLRNNGRIRDILTDRFGVIDKIIDDEKQFSRMQKAFARAAEKFNLEEIPQTPEEIRKTLRIGLID